MTVRLRDAVRYLLVAVVLVVMAPPARAQVAQPPTRRIAVLVGANDAPPGHAPLRFAHADAQQLADALIRVGHFAPADVHVLLDPPAADLAGALTAATQDVQAAAGDALLLFYYSGHSDGQSLFPHGEAVAVGSLRDRIEHIGARIRVGILDTCSGGSWTQAKGLSVGPPLDAADLFNVSTEGTALVSSSSGLENAHEADAVSGSFFTHHFTAGLLGAADRAGDGNITLEEAFDYAKERTVRDSARFASVPQHPSFDIQLRGRQDIVLTSVAASPSALEVTQSRETLEIIHLASGVTIAEVPPSSRPLRIAVPPGRYLVRSIVDDRVFSHELEIRPGETVVISGGQLEATGDARLALKGDAEPARPNIDEPSTPPKGWGVFQLLLGQTTDATVSGGASGYTANGGLVQYFARVPSMTFGITDRLVFAFPGALAYRFGTAGHVETIVYGGMSYLAPEVSAASHKFTVVGVTMSFAAGTAVRIWTATRQSVVLVAGATCALAAANDPGDSYPLVCGAGVSAGYSLNLGTVVTLNFGASVSNGGYFVTLPWSPSAANTFINLGGVSSLAFRPLPLFEAHVSPRFSLDASGSWSYNPTTGAQDEEVLGGFTYAY